MKEIILVAGYNYPHYTWKGGSARIEGRDPKEFREVVDAYVKRYTSGLTTDELKELRITIFDVGAGKVEVTKGGEALRSPVGERTLPERRHYLVYHQPERLGQPEEISAAPPNTDMDLMFYFPGASQLKRRTFTLKQYVDHFHEGAELFVTSELGAADVYNYIRKIAKERPQTVSELHLMSHSFADGPILLNTLSFFDWVRPNESALRDPLDQDCRRNKDFNEGTLGPKSTFRLAFAEGAFSFVWGCNPWTFPMRMIQNLQRGRNASASGQDDPVELTWTKSWGNRALFLALIKNTCATATVRPDKSIVATFTWAVAKNALCALLRDTYMQRLADYSGKPVYGPPPGTGTSRSSDRLMHVSRNPKEHDNYLGIVDFYRNRLNVPFDAKWSAKGYATFKPVD